MRWLHEARAARRRSAIWLLPLASCLALGGCAARGAALPGGPGSPFPDYSAVHARIAAACGGVRTLTAEIALRGRSATRRLSGRLVAGFERPDSMHLSWVTSFGPPGFVLTSRFGTASLLLPREERVIEGESAEDILGALTGLSLGPADLQAILTGCVVPAPRPLDGREYGNRWAAIDLEGGTTLYLRRGGEWQLSAATRGGWQIDYLAWQGAFPRSIRLRSDDVEMTAALSQLEANIDIDPAAFVTDIPPAARPWTLAELREAGLLGARE